MRLIEAILRWLRAAVRPARAHARHTGPEPPSEPHTPAHDGSGCRCHVSPAVLKLAEAARRNGGRDPRPSTDVTVY